MSVVVSIIVPVYNVEKYLKECVDSLINQTYKDFEIILVNDGSTDRSGVICDSYAKQDDRVKVYHKPNGGVSSARNFGLKMAQGNYLVFIDADDAVHINYLKVMMNGILINGVNMVICRYTNNWTQLEDLSHDIKVKPASYIYDDGLDNKKHEGYFDGFLWNKVFCREIVENNNISFLEKCTMWEDMLFFLEYLQYVNNIAFIEATLYFYRMRDDSAVQTMNIEKAYHKILVMKCIQNKVQFPSKSFHSWHSRAYLDSILSYGMMAIKKREYTKERKKELIHNLKTIKCHYTIRDLIKVLVLNIL